MCQKCSTQLNNCYKFILQAREVYEQYLETLDELGAEEEVKDFENIPEPLIELPIDFNTVEKSPLGTKESPLATAESPLSAGEIKTEPLTVECMPKARELMNVDNLPSDNDIKEEKPEYVDYNSTSSANTEKIGVTTDLTIELLPEDRSN